MGALEIIVGILVILVSIVIIAAVVFQNGSRRGVNAAVAGGSDTFLSKNQTKTKDAQLAKITKFGAIAFFVLVLVAHVITLLAK